MGLYLIVCLYFCVFISGEGLETVELSEYTMNPEEPKAGPHDFDLLKLLGKGGYGKVSYVFYTS